ncbi:MAG TPA: class I SAM-dependent methyltransferase [Oligoflexia bacterium]|nr:class I SAM-dependent methyltransferase [Oligoflexia bacterium]HMR24236.1 class I SAM-dependent methyltransferase [Oligoflexia bacterium]
MSLTQICHQLVLSHQRKFLNSIDATCGNGHDTKFLLENTQAQGRVFAFDVQEQALLETQKKCTPILGNKQLICFHTSHAQMSSSIPKSIHQHIDLIMFNLGYLPGGQNKHLCTQKESTLSALEQCLFLLKPGGLISILAYPGHSQGKVEKESIEKWLHTQQIYTFTEHHHIKKNTAPVLWLLKLNK